MTRRNISLGSVFRLFLGRAPRLSFSDVVCVRRVTQQSINPSMNARIRSLGIPNVILCVRENDPNGLTIYYPRISIP